MKILVTGGTGFIGTNLIKQLLKEKHEVHSLDNYSVGTQDNEQKGCNYHSGDIENVGLMDGDFDVCFHLAALSRIQPSFNNPTETIRVNTMGTNAVMDWAHECGTRVIFAGSSSVHHEPTQSPYSTSKVMAEEIVKMYRKVYNIRADIVRFYNVYGPHEITEGDMSAVIGRWRNQVKLGVPITIVGDGDQRRDFTHVDDVVDGLIRVMKFNMNSLNDAWELGTGSNYSMNEVFNMFRKYHDCTCDYINHQKGNYQKTIRVNDEALEILKWKPTDRLEEYIKNL